MDHTISIDDHGQWLSFRLPLGETDIPVRISREAMERHFDAATFDSLADAYRHHAEQVHLRVAPLVRQGSSYSRDHPLMVASSDL